MPTIVAPEIQCKADSEERNFAVDFIGRLDAGELLTGTPTVAEIGSSDLAITNVVINTIALTINGVAVAIGQAIQYKVTGGTVGTTYRLLVTALTDASVAQTLKAIVRLEVIDDT